MFKKMMLLLMGVTCISLVGCTPKLSKAEQVAIDQYISDTEAVIEDTDVVTYSSKYEDGVLKESAHLLFEDLEVSKEDLYQWYEIIEQSLDGLPGEYVCSGKIEYETEFIIDGCNGQYTLKYRTGIGEKAVDITSPDGSETISKDELELRYLREVEEDSPSQNTESTPSQNKEVHSNSPLHVQIQSRSEKLFNKWMSESGYDKYYLDHLSNIEHTDTQLETIGGDGYIIHVSLIPEKGHAVSMSGKTMYKCCKYVSETLHQEFGYSVMFKLDTTETGGPSAYSTDGIYFDWRD